MDMSNSRFVIEHLMMSYDWLKAKYRTSQCKNWFTGLSPRNRAEQHVKSMKEEAMTFTENYKVVLNTRPFQGKDAPDTIIQVEVTVKDKAIQNNLKDFKQVTAEDYELQDDGSWHFYAIVADNPATRGLIAALEQHGKLNTGNTDTDFYIAALVKILVCDLWD
jgi:hypothetical protein